MVLSTPFTCPNGHSFTANAKLRARCPECGLATRKSFTSTPPVPPKESDPKVSPIVEAKVKPKIEPPNPIRVLRRGRNSTPPKEKPMPKYAGSNRPKKKGLVSHKKIRQPLVPAIRGKPTGSREHKIATVVGEDKPYWHQVADKYGI